MIRSSDAGLAEIADFDGSITTQSYRRGEYVWTQGETSRGLYCLQSGYVILWRMHDRQFRTGFRVVGPGELLGYRSLFAGDPHVATAEALTSCFICLYPREKLMPLTRHSGGLGLSFLRLVARDRGPPDGLYLRSPQLPTRTRLVYLLLILKENCARREGKYGLQYNLPLLRRDIGWLIASRPESVTRAAHELRENGIAFFSGKQVRVPDERRMREEMMATEKGRAGLLALSLNQEGFHDLSD